MDNVFESSIRIWAAQPTQHIFSRLSAPRTRARISKLWHKINRLPFDYFLPCSTIFQRLGAWEGRVRAILMANCSMVWKVRMEAVTVNRHWGPWRSRRSRGPPPLDSRVVGALTSEPRGAPVRYPCGVAKFLVKPWTRRENKMIFWAVLWDRWRHQAPLFYLRSTCGKF